MLSYPTAAMIFAIINFCSLLGCLFLITKFISFKNTFYILFFTLFINYRYLESHVANNQVAFILILLILLSIYIKNDALAGILLSLAILIKLTPAIFLFTFYTNANSNDLVTHYYFQLFGYISHLYMHMNITYNHYQTGTNLY